MRRPMPGRRCWGLQADRGVYQLICNGLRGLGRFGELERAKPGDSLAMDAVPENARMLSGSREDDTGMSYQFFWIVRKIIDPGAL